jgi:hypothetical protein
VSSYSWINIGLATAIGCLLILLAWWHLRKGNHYDVRDLLLDHASNRAALDKHILLMMALLASWVVIDRELDGKDTETILLGVLGIFVLQRSATQAMTTFGPKQDK